MTTLAADQVSNTLPLMAWLQPALQLPLIEISIDVTVRRRVQLTAPTCAVVRGLLGQRLRELRCQSGARACGGCALTATCDFARIFDDGATHPFWFRGVPADRHLRCGARFVARLYLATPAHQSAQYLDVAFRDALHRSCGDATLAPSRWRRAALGALAPQPLPASEVRISATTPLCLRGDEVASHRLCPQVPWLGLLVRAGVRRLDALVRSFALPDGARTPRAQLPDLSAVTAVRDTLAPWTSTRFSHRQDRRVPLTGADGEAVLVGEALRPLAPLLGALTVSSVGKATSLGLGGLAVTPVHADRREGAVDARLVVVS